MKTITLTKDQFLSDVAKDLPTTNGIHLHIAPTGCGKTFHMMRNAHDTHGTVIFPVKAIKEQQQLEQVKEKLFNAVIEQIERLPNVGDPIFFDGCSLHVDEAQILYQGGFRRSVEKLIHFINEAAKTMPVYLYSATARPELLPVTLETINYINKPFNREINVIQIPKHSEIKGCPIWIATALDEILKTDHQLPLLCFINSNKMAKSIKAQLQHRGHDDVIIIDSKRTSEDEDKTPIYPLEYSVYKNILKNKAINGCGKRIILATDCMAEGINILDKFHVVSVQVEAGKVFQQQGRARGEAVHWLITGDGIDSLQLVDSKLYCYTSKDDKKFSYEVKDDSKLTDIKCDWSDSKANNNAKLSALMVKHFQRGRYGVQVIDDLQNYGYTVSNQFDLTDVVKRRISGIEISKQEMMKIIAIHDCPLWMDRKSPLFVALLKRYEVELFDRQFALAVDWKSSFDLLEQQGIKLSCWEVYQRVNQFGRGWLQWVFASRQSFESTVRDVNEFRQVVNEVIASNKGDVKETAKGGKGGRLKGEDVDMLSNLFWSSVMPKETEFNWWKAENQRMRSTLFKLLMGFIVDDANNWNLPADRPEWCLPLTSAENKAFKRREPHITKAGVTVEDFCLTTGNTTKSIALLKTKEVKTLVNSIVF